MYFMPKYRYNPESGREEDYLTLKEWALFIDA